MQNNELPLFPENYRSYDKEEFLLDAKIEFANLKNLLERPVHELKQDEHVALDIL